MQGLFLAELEIHLLKVGAKFLPITKLKFGKKKSISFFFLNITDRKLLEQDYHAVLVFVTDFL